MEAGQARIGQIEPRTADAAGDPDLSVSGTQSIREVMVATEVEVASMLARADAAVARVIADADATARAKVSDHRRQLADVRQDLALRAAAVAVAFESVLGLLDEADERMAVPEPPRAVPDPAPAPVFPAAAEPATVSGLPAEPEQPKAAAPTQTATFGRARPAPPRLRLAQSPDPAAPRSRGLVGGEVAADGEADGQPRRRWWRRWFRQAA